MIEAHQSRLKQLQDKYQYEADKAKMEEVIRRFDLFGSWKR